MNTKQILAAVAIFAAAGSAIAADNGIYVDHSGFVSTRTRAEVQAELAQAQAASPVARNSEFVEHVQVATTKSRDDVRKEALQSARSQAIQPVYFGG